MRHPLMQREYQKRDLTTRELEIRADSVDVDAGTVEAVVATDQPVTVFDMNSFRTIDEILVAEGGEFPTRIPLLDSHHREQSKDVLGSATAFVRNGSEWSGRTEFDLDDPAAQRIFNKVRKKHIDAVSIGYRVSDSVDIPPGKSQNIDGRRYQAQERVLRVSKKWHVRELSVTPIGADSNAKFRDSAEDFKERIMNPRLTEYLRRLGLKDEDPREYIVALKGSSRSIASLLDHDEGDASAATTCDFAIRSLGFDPKEPWNMRDDLSKTILEIATQSSSNDDGVGEDPPSFEDGQKAERERQTAIRELGENLEYLADDVVLAIREGDTPDAAAFRFLTRTRELRGQGQGADRPEEGQTRVDRCMLTNMRVLGTAPEARATTRESVRNAISLSMALMERAGIDPVTQFVSVENEVLRNVGESHRDDLERAAENANQMRGISIVDVAQECLHMNGATVPRYSSRAVIAELQRSAAGTATFTGIITTNFSAQLLSGYNTSTDTTGPWTREAEVPDFRTTDRPRVLQGDPLTRHARGGEAESVTFSDKNESYKAARYSGQFVVDEQDMIDDRFGALDSLAPTDMGVAARQIRPDLVYSILFANANMGDGVALFATAHGNLVTSSALTVANLKIAISAMNTQTENGRLLDKAGPLIVLVPELLSFDAEQFLNSSQISNDSGDGNLNTLRSRATQIVSDGRLDNGVTDPSTGTTYSGADDNWYVMRSQGRHTIEVGYVRGSGRAPTVRSFILTQGKWGVGWDVKLDIGAKALDWLGMRAHRA